MSPTEWGHGMTYQIEVDKNQVLVSVFLLKLVVLRRLRLL